MRQALQTRPLSAFLSKSEAGLRFLHAGHIRGRCFLPRVQQMAQRHETLPFCLPDANVINWLTGLVTSQEWHFFIISGTSLGVAMTLLFRISMSDVSTNVSTKIEF